MPNNKNKFIPLHQLKVLYPQIFQPKEFSAEIDAMAQRELEQVKARHPALFQRTEQEIAIARQPTRPLRKGSEY